MNEELSEQGIVLKSENGFTEIELVANDKCDECSAKLYCNPNLENSKKLAVQNNYDFNVGDKVTLTILGKNLLFAAFNLYFYPMLLLIFSIFIGTRIFTDNSEIYSFIVGVFVVTIYYGVFFRLSKKLNYNEPKYIISKIE